MDNPVQPGDVEVQNPDGTRSVYRNGGLVFVWPAPVHVLVELPTGQESTPPPITG